MFVIEVIPIAKSVGVDSLSYFTGQAVPLGALVSVPLRKKTVQGIVTNIRPAADMKSEIKTATFALKKLDEVKSTEFFSKPFMDTVEATALYFATSAGSVLDILVPEYILGNVSKLKKPKV